MLRKRISDLNKFLKNSGLDAPAKEISFLEDKFAAGKPLPLNEASIDQVVQELIDGLAAKFLAYGVGPLDVLSTVLQGGGRIPSHVIGSLYSTASTNKRNVGKKSINILYVLKFSFDPGDVALSEVHPVDKDRRKIEITLGPNPPFLSEAAKYLEDSGKSMNAQDFFEQIIIFSNMARPFIERAIYHEETHSLDIVGNQREAESVYKVEQPGESIGRILQKLNISFLSFIIDNQHIFDPMFSTLDYNAIDEALRKKIMFGDERDFNKIESDTKKYVLSAGTPIVLLSRSGSQVVLSKPRSLNDVSKSHGIDPERLFLLNFNKLNDSNEPYEAIYSAPDSYKKRLLNEVLPKDYEVVFTPSYRDLYRNYYDFYLLTREESVAHFNQIRKEMQNELKRLSESQIKDLDFYKFLKLTNTVDLYLEAIKIKPFDKYIKTPFDGKTMDIIKKQRSKDFYNRMYWLWGDLVDKNEQT